MRRSFGRLDVECVRGDICDQGDVDAVVCAANAGLAPGAGVAGAIHAKAGPGLYEECKPLAPISTGGGVITGGHGLPNDWCIHVLGPVYASSADPEVDLRSCYRTTIGLADSKELTALATPAISTGVFGYPVDEAAAIASSEVALAGRGRGSVSLVRFVLWSPEDLRTHVHALEGVTG